MEELGVIEVEKKRHLFKIETKDEIQRVCKELGVSECDE